MRATIPDFPLTIGSLFRYGTTFHGDAAVITATDDGSRRTSYAELAGRVARLANALRSLGVSGDDRVGTFMWNNQEHLEAYLAIPCMGAVLHTLNIRLLADQVAWIADHAEDKVVIVDASLVPLFAKILPNCSTVRSVLVAGAGADLSALAGAGVEVASYDEALAAASPTYAWPDVDESSAAAMCYTSGTTGNPKGVVYSHRSTWLHSYAGLSVAAVGMNWEDRVLPIVPMFHANAWGEPYSALMAGADLLMPDRWLAAERLVPLIERERPTISGGVPTVWLDVLNYVRKNGGDVSSLRTVLCGGSAVPRSLIEGFEELGIPMLQGWGMTETSPVASVAKPPRGVTGEAVLDYRASQGRLLFGVEGRLVGDDGSVLPNDGKSVGELQVRGPWVTTSYYREDDAAKFDDGWLRTGDVGTLDPQGYIVLTDRAKDVIKSGGEWISSVQLENELMGHPAVLEAAVVAVPDEKWQERPLATIVVKEGQSVTAAELQAYLADRVAKWWIPERWAFIDEVPRTSVGKFDKKVLRRQYADGELSVEETGSAGSSAR